MQGAALEYRGEAVPENKGFSQPTSLSTIVDLYRQHSSLGRRTVKNNILSMLKIFERVRGHRVDTAKISLSEISARLVVEFQAAAVIAYQAGAPPDDPSQREAKERALRSSKSTVNQARCLFTRRGDTDMIDLYAQFGIAVPKSVQEFMTCRVRGRSTKTDYHIPGDTVIRSAFEEIELMKKDRHVYLAFWLAVGAGLRRKEIFYCRWEHCIEVDGCPWVVGGIGKDGRQITVPIQMRAWEAMKPFRKQSGYVIEQRSDRWARRLSRWMRTLGWSTKKTIHELRAYCGSLLYAKNPVAAMYFLRHKSIAVTEKYYVRYSKAVERIEVL